MKSELGLGAEGEAQHLQQQMHTILAEIEVVVVTGVCNHKQPVKMEPQTTSNGL